MSLALHLPGLSPYPESLALMERLVEARHQGDIPDVILLLEHPPVITVGRARGADEHVRDAGPVPVVPVSRGGDVTLHGPGQLVAYPIVALPTGRRDLIRHLRALEQAVLDLLDDLGMPGTRDPRNTGVWLPHPDGPPRKVCAVGIACRRWVTWHGLALNLHIDVAGFARIHPCGFGPDTVTRLADHLPDCPRVHDLAPHLAPYLARTLKLALEGPVMRVPLADVPAWLGLPPVAHG
jgi:lipoyl(octanoyl) transferase